MRRVRDRAPRPRDGAIGSQPPAERRGDHVEFAREVARLSPVLAFVDLDVLEGALLVVQKDHVLRHKEVPEDVNAPARHGRRVRPPRDLLLSRLLHLHSGPYEHAPARTRGRHIQRQYGPPTLLVCGDLYEVRRVKLATRPVSGNLGGAASREGEARVRDAPFRAELEGCRILAVAHDAVVRHGEMRWVREIFHHDLVAIHDLAR